MPTIDVDMDELRRLVGHPEKGDDELKSDLFSLGLEFEGETEDDELQFEFEPDRLDRLSVEGVARSLQYQYGDRRGVYVPETNRVEWTIEVDPSIPDERPYVTGAIVRGLDIDERTLRSIIQLQEKLHATIGRAREKGSIGIHDLALLKGRPAVDGGEPEITYRGIDPDGDRFVPLAYEEMTPDDYAVPDAGMTPAEVLEIHETGRTYAPLVSGYERYPAIYDERGLFSFPPVINGLRTEVTTDTRDLFIEMTGTDQWTIDRMLTIVCYALDARGGTVEAVDVSYPDHDLRRPDFEVDRKTVRHERVEALLGIDLSVDDVVDLAERSGLDAEAHEVGDDELAYEVEVPAYRTDVLHPVDIVDDLGRAHGFNELVPRYPDVSTIGGRHERSRVERAARDVLSGLGFEDLLDFHLTSRAANFDRMRLSPGDDVLGGGEPATITEPYSEEYEIVRTWALPSILTVLENNTHRAYPQDLAEVGVAARVDPDENTHVAEWRTVAGALARTDASYEDAKARLSAICRRFEVALETPPTTHPTFVEGRTAEILTEGEPVGVIGEVHPEVLVEHDLEVPVAAFEFRLSGLR